MERNKATGKQSGKRLVREWVDSQACQGRFSWERQVVDAGTRARAGRGLPFCATSLGRARSDIRNACLGGSCGRRRGEGESWVGVGGMGKEGEIVFG